MNFEDFKNDVSNTVWTSAAEYFRASIPKPPAKETPKPQPIIAALPAQVGGVDQKTLLVVGGSLLVVVALVLLAAKKGKK